MKKEHVTLSETDRAYLEALLKKSNIPASQYKRARTLWELDRGCTFRKVAQLVGITHQTASKWADKYQQSGLDALKDNPRSGRPIMIEGEQRAKITALACSEAPEGYERWSLRLLANKAVELGIVESISYTEVGRILKKTNSSLT